MCEDYREQRAIAAAVSEVDEAKCLSRGDAPSAPYGQLKLVAGVDISFRSSADSSFGEDCTDAVAVLVVCEFPSMQVVRTLSRTVSLQQPYIPGFLAFREGEPLLLLAQEALSLPEHEQPQLLFGPCILTDPPARALTLFLSVDGNGLLHERRCGLATYIGVKSGLPTVGVAKDYHPFSSTPPEAHLASQRAMREHCRTALQKRGDSLTLFDPPLGAVRAL